MGINIFLFLAIFFVLVFFIGKFFEKFKIPWIFSSLIIGFFLAIKNPFENITSSVEFGFLADLGLVFLLFIIGFEIDLKKIKKVAGFIFGATFFIIFIEAVIGSLFIHFLFGFNWFISFIIGVSFATVGEVILVPILDEFKLVNTKLGQMILGIGTFDDVIEVAVLAILVLFLGVKSPEISQGGVLISALALIFVFALTFFFLRLKGKEKRFEFSKIENVFLISIAILFLFLGIGEFSGSIALAALLAGISLKTFLPNTRLKNIESEMKSLAYGFFGPIFFLSVGLVLDVNYVFSSFWIILILFAVAAFSKIFASYVLASKRIGKKDSILLGIGLSARFSTSIVIIKILFDSGLINENLYSLIVASSILFTIVIPIIFSRLIVKWKLKK